MQSAMPSHEAFEPNSNSVSMIEPPLASTKAAFAPGFGKRVLLTVDTEEEFDWDGRELRVGEVVLRVLERTDRCKSTHSNPETGKRDADVLGALDSWGHQDFSVRAEVIRGGAIKTGDEVARV